MGLKYVLPDIARKFRSRGDRSTTRRLGVRAPTFSDRSERRGREGPLPCGKIIGILCFGRYSEDFKDAGLRPPVVGSMVSIHDCASAVASRNDGLSLENESLRELLLIFL